MSWVAIGGSVAGAAVGGLMSGGGGGGGGGDQTVVNVPWKGLQPYLVGDGGGYLPQMQQPLSSGWLYRNYLASQGLPVGPPPPMRVDDPRYTGEGVYDAPFEHQPLRTGGTGYSQQPEYGGIFGAPPVGTDGPYDLGGYPSGRPGDGNVTVPAPAAPPVEQQPAAGGMDAAMLDRAEQYLQAKQIMLFGNQAWEVGGRDVSMLDAMQWAQANQDADAKAIYRAGLLSPYGRGG